VLQEANKRFGYLPEAVLKFVSHQLEMSYAEVYGIASFYKSFRLEPCGEHVIQVCMGTACHVRGAPRVLEEFQRRLEVDAGRTTGDGLFTLETVNCIGACALGPVVVIDGEYHGQMTASKVPKIIEQYQDASREVGT
jgi:NADH:ubiquinone oxidoreductase subunit E